MGTAMGRLLNLNLWELFGWKQEVRILILGLGIAGKTAIINKLKLGKVVDTIPTVGPHIETVEYNNINFTFWEFGGQIKFQPWLRHFFHGGQAQGIIFVVDSCDRERIIDARNDLNIILNAEEAKDGTVLVFANKQDLPTAMGTEEIAKKLGLQCIRNRRWHIQSGSATSGEGLYEAMDWLCTNTNTKA